MPGAVPAPGLGLHAVSTRGPSRGEEGDATLQTRDRRRRPQGRLASFELLPHRARRSGFSGQALHGIGSGLAPADVFRDGIGGFCRLRLRNSRQNPLGCAKRRHV